MITTFAVTYKNGKTDTIEAFDIEGADYIAWNLSALYGWGGVTLLKEAA